MGRPPVSLRLWDVPPSRWEDLAAPAGYERWWRSIVLAAVAAGVGPADLGERFAEVAARARWSASTCALYAKVLRYGGVAVDVPPTPEPSMVPSVRLEWLWDRPDPPVELAWWRMAAWARLLVGWPASLGAWVALRTEQVAVDGADAVVAGRRVVGAGELWRDYLDERERAGAASEWALGSLRPGRWPDARTGDRLSVRGAQAAWRTHLDVVASRAADRGAPPADVAALRALTFTGVRRAAIAAGAEPVDVGVVRAARIRRRSDAAPTARR